MRNLTLTASLVLMVGCASTVAQSPMDKVTAATADVRVTNLTAPVVMRVGQTLGIQPPGQGVEWQVDYDAESLLLVTPAAELTKPGIRGWVWQAAKAGQSELVLTSIAKCDVLPCAPNVMKFTVQLEVKSKE